MTYNTDRLMREATLPGIVKEQRTEYELICYAKDMHGELAKGERLNLNRALEAGKALNQLKEMSEHGSFGDKLAKTRIPRQRASEYMRLAKCPPGDISACQSINEALKLIKEEEPQQVATIAQVEVTKDQEVGIANHKPKSKAKAKKPPKGSPRAVVGPGADDDTVGMPYESSVVRDRAAYPNRIEEFFDTREMTKAEAEHAKRAFETAFKAFVELAGRPERPAFLIEKECWHCHAPVTVGRTEATNRVMVVEAAKKGGGFDIIDGKIVSCAGGRFKNHHAFCTKGFSNGQKRS